MFTANLAYFKKFFSDMDESQKITKLSSRNVEISHACYRLNSNIIIIGQPQHPVVGRRPQHAGPICLCTVDDINIYIKFTLSDFTRSFK